MRHVVYARDPRNVEPSLTSFKKRKEETGRTTASVHNSETEVGRYSI